MGQYCGKESCDAFADNLERDGKLAHQRGKDCKERWYSDCETDSDGCRVFDQLPPPGTHPRLFFTEAEIPALLARFTCTADDSVGYYMKGLLNVGMNVVAQQELKLSELSPSERETPGQETIEKFLTSDPARNDALFLAYVHVSQSQLELGISVVSFSIAFLITSLYPSLGLKYQRRTWRMTMRRKAR